MLGLVVYVGFQTPYRCVWKWGYHGIPPLYDVVFFPFLLYCSWGLGSCTTLRLPQHGHLIWTMLILTNKIKGVPEEKKLSTQVPQKKKLNPATRSSCLCVAATSRAWWYRRSCRGFQWFLFTNLNALVTVNISRNGVFTTVSYIALLNPWWKSIGSVHFGVRVYEGIELQGDGRDGIMLKCQNYRLKVLPEMHANVILPVVTSTAHWIAWFGHTSKQMRWCFIDCIIVVSYCPTNFMVSNLNCFLVKGIRKHLNESNYI